MTNPLKALIRMGVVPTVTFPTDSRYYGSQTLSYTAPNGQTVSATISSKRMAISRCRPGTAWRRCAWRGSTVPI